MGNSIRPKMDRSNRAKQFMPFDALTGLRAALAGRERIIVPKRELSEEQKAELDYKLQMLKIGDMITVAYFHEGAYVQVTGMVSRIDVRGRALKIVNTQISFDDIADLKEENN